MTAVETSHHFKTNYTIYGENKCSIVCWRTNQPEYAIFGYNINLRMFSLSKFSLFCYILLLRN